MSTAQVNLNAVSSPVTSRARAQTGKADASFSDILSKENNAAKGRMGESKVNIASDKYSKEGNKTSAINTDNQPINKISDKAEAGKNDAVYQAKDSMSKSDKNVVQKVFNEEPENDGEAQDEKVKALMAVLASLIIDISRKTGTDEAAVKDFITENNLTSANLLDIDSWKGFVTEVNGLDNISAILTNDEAFKNLEDISEIINAHLDEMGQMTTGMTEGVTDENQAAKEVIEPDKKEVISLSEVLSRMFDRPKKSELIAGEKEVEAEDTIEKDMVEPVAIMPLSGGMNGGEAANTQAGFEHNEHNLKGDKQNASAEVTGVSSQNLFDNIAANLQKLEGTNSLPEGTTAKAILEQVTNQIHNLHAPDKTSLEFMLTPETLGKVAVNVSSKQGVLQAEFRVESAQAKAALESQMAELKLNFENQGLKVASVSVMISENGIGKDDQGKNTGEGEKKNSKRNRSFSLDGEEGIEGIDISSEGAVPVYTDSETGNNINLGA